MLPGGCYDRGVIDPRSLALASDHDDDTERFARMTPEQRLAIFLELCVLTDSIVRNQRELVAMLGQDERIAKWDELCARVA